MIKSRTNTLNMFAAINSLVMLFAAILLFQQVYFRPIPVIPNTYTFQQQDLIIDEPQQPILPIFDPGKIDNFSRDKGPEIKIPPIKIPPRTDNIVRVTPTDQVPLPLAKMILDNFDQISQVNATGGFGNVFGGTGGFCLRSYQQGNSAGTGEENGYILKLVYNVKNGYAGYYRKLNGLDLNKYHRIAFYVKGAKGGEVFEVELGDGSASYKVDVREYLPYGASTAWQKVSIPLTAFTDVKNWDKMQGNFAIIFEQYLGIPNNSTLYVDNITFEE
ncbi:MAG: carbohydrate binding domain-containing protein [bacterium]|nr:carbohydrate binding domain-containing protein [bacterium]